MIDFPLKKMCSFYLLQGFTRHVQAGCYHNLQKITLDTLSSHRKIITQSFYRSRTKLLATNPPELLTGSSQTPTFLALSRPLSSHLAQSVKCPNQSRNHVNLFHSTRSYSHQNSPGEENSTPRTKDKWENIYTIPNILTVGRFVAAPFLGYMVCSEQYGAACTLFLLAGLTDLLDGYIARNWPGQASILGTVIDPLADKFLVTILSVSLAAVHLLPVWLMAVILTRDVYLVISGFRVRYVTLPPPKTLKRYFDFSLPSATVKPTFISKVNTNIQILLLSASIAAPVFDFVNHPFLHLLWGVTTITTAWSFVSYLTTAPYTVLKN